MDYELWANIGWVAVWLFAITAPLGIGMFLYGVFHRGR